jgi:uroporphyrinogen-III synthase
MRILLTRPREDAERLAAKLTALGHSVMIEPLIAIAPIDAVDLPLDGVQALLFTSANGVRAFARATERRDLRVMAVGEATANAALAAGFSRVESAGGDVEDLARLVRQRLTTDDGPLLHVAATDVAGDLKTELEQAEFSVRRVALYRAEPVAQLSDAAVAALRAGEIDVAVVFSPAHRADLRAPGARGGDRRSVRPRGAARDQQERERGRRRRAVEGPGRCRAT